MSLAPSVGLSLPSVPCALHPVRGIASEHALTGAATAWPGLTKAQPSCKSSIVIWPGEIGPRQSRSGHMSDVQEKCASTKGDSDLGENARDGHAFVQSRVSSAV